MIGELSRRQPVRAVAAALAVACLLAVVSYLRDRPTEQSLRVVRLATERLLTVDVGLSRLPADRAERARYVEDAGERATRAALVASTWVDREVTRRTEQVQARLAAGLDAAVGPDAAAGPQAAVGQPGVGGRFVAEQWVRIDQFGDRAQVAVRGRELYLRVDGSWTAGRAGLWRVQLERAVGGWRLAQVEPPR